MPVTSDQARAFTDFLTAMFSDLQEKHRATIEQQIEVQQGLLEQYRQYLEKERSNESDAFQHFTKLMMSTFMQAVTVQRETRMRLLDLHSSLADAHLAFLAQMKDGLAGAAARDAPAGKPSNGGAKAK